MKVIAKGFSASLFTPKIEESVTKRTKIISDGSTSYCDLKKDFDHQPRVIPDKEIKNVLPWVHTSISNAKRLLLDTHHRSLTRKNINFNLVLYGVGKYFLCPKCGN